jgi:hypothetical protein
MLTVVPVNLVFLFVILIIIEQVLVIEREQDDKSFHRLDRHTFFGYVDIVQFFPRSYILNQ